MSEHRHTPENSDYEKIENQHLAPHESDERLLSKEYDEETASEYTPNPGLVGGRGPIEISSDKTRETDREREDTTGKGSGALGIAFSFISLFFLPVIFAVAGIVLGAIAIKNEQRALGYTAISISAFSIVMSFFFAPFVI
ncbi:hypothetical protein CR194_01735 [Salipaludibacillus keqinensis]|uniref:DUF4190 domain-containing protein n=1 Tax=Salipaludibacillus keqinensis TaxID=2045207 RepID=A0A323TNE3_9BACI|nr:DUF4190 domain-containing protein [Salipaludibacillus keqinensis]PYZ94283.1 hypothetical protein CR194_01735 [Salipaludibacillus keqinensis]